MRRSLRLPVAVEPGFAESNNSALANSLLPLSPPHTRSLPPGSRVAVCHRRSLERLPVVNHLLVSGSYNSVLARKSPLYPPVITTFPFGSRLALCHCRATDSALVPANAPL